MVRWIGALLVLLVGCGSASVDEVNYIEEKGSTEHQQFVAAMNASAGWTELDGMARQLGFKKSAFPYYARPDGCSGGTSDDAKKRFRQACTLHDICFRIGASRKKCDDNFRINMEKKCTALNVSSRAWCHTEARLMYQAVRINLKGHTLFQKRIKGQKAFESKMLMTAYELGKVDLSTVLSYGLTLPE